ncbi:MAG TPA: hypothetical protein VMO26_02725 [Vicinamibacterales bacterium]|nr:hypothetical protein [Vicinamibacterales bacterium]
MAAIGIAVGLLASLGVARLVAGLLFDISPADPVTLGGVAVLLGVVTLAASHLPARRALRVDPVVALRRE